MAHETILFDKREHVAIITLNRPERLNAISAALRAEVQDAVNDAHHDDGIRALIITGTGRGFCSGADLTAAASAIRGTLPPPTTQAERLDEDSWVGRWAKMFHHFDKPVIAAVNGGGCRHEHRACGGHARWFRTCSVQDGVHRASLSPDSGMSYFLPRIVGYARAADLIFTSRTVDAQEAYRLGLLDRLVPHDNLLEEAVRLANEMTQWPPLALRVSKRVLQHNFEADIDDAMRYETVGLAMGRRATNDAKEAMLAFSEKRKPKYTGS